VVTDTGHHSVRHSRADFCLAGRDVDNGEKVADLISGACTTRHRRG
jgi:hypothetical protein